MARSLRDLRRKMKAIKSTRQVTKAMELVAASKMRRAVQNAQLLRKYAIAAWKVLQKIALRAGSVHPYTEERDVKKVLAVVFSSDRGLCGSLNAQLLRSLSQYIQSLSTVPGFEGVEFIAVGRKGQQFLARGGHKVIAAFPALSNHPKFRDVLPICRMASEAFIAGTVDHVVLVYADFVSPLVQEPAIKVLLPFSKSVLREMIDGLMPRSKANAESAIAETSDTAQYVFEPSPEQVLEVILPQLTEIQVYQAALESAASEHSARMVAMRNATENASSILDDLTLTYNQTRQANITAELAELSASKAALE